MPCSFVWIAGSLLVVIGSSLVRAESPNTDELRTAITRGAKWLQDDMQKWRDERKCGACHHAPMALFSLNGAKNWKEAVAPEFFADLTHWSFTDENARLAPPEPGADEPRPAQMMPAVYLSWGVNAFAESTPEITAVRQRLIKHFQRVQQEDGSWTGPAGRPPVLTTPVEVTLLVLAAWEPHRSEFPEFAPMLDKAAAWLDAQPRTNSHQELALRAMWHASRRAAAAQHLSELVNQLKSLQQPDGGWKQSPEEPSDAFATGQTLFALRQAGVSADDLAIQRGVQFLIKAQQPDGSWPMTSRPHPENKSRAGNLNPITYAGSAWGMAGLTAAVRDAD